MRKTKIVCTLGPASSTYDQIKKMALAGMNVARINMSHGTHSEHQAKIDTVKKVRRSLGMPIPIMIDTKGPEVRICTFEVITEFYSRAAHTEHHTQQHRCGNTEAACFVFHL